MTASTIVRVEDPTAVGDARRRATALATELAFGETERGTVAVVVTETATNVHRHGGGGEILLRGVDDATGRYVEVIGLDRGRGIPDVERAMRDGFSTYGSAGTGLGAIARMSASFDLWSSPGAGTAVLARVGKTVDGPFDVGGLSIPAPSEHACGDDWVVHVDGARARVAVVDGLGHGRLAEQAAGKAIEAIGCTRGRTLVEALDETHGALRPTRGAAIGVADVDLVERTIEWVGVGNVAGVVVVGARRAQSTVSLGGIVGHNVRKIHPYRYALPAEACLVLCSDGLATSWSLEKYPGLPLRHPALVAAILFRDFTRARDDVTVVAIRERTRGAVA